MLLFVLVIIAMRATALQASSQIDADVEAGILDVETATLYRTYTLLDPFQLPDRYREESGSATCGTPTALEIREGLRRLSVESAVTI
ncbi:MAG: hypothetical protein HY709_11830, partial [Candidatus Latescibacteria bacterium]|nr:hypothetical protein [Candidatus Latescibacterota bacterium]